MSKRNRRSFHRHLRAMHRQARSNEHALHIEELKIERGIECHHMIAAVITLAVIAAAAIALQHYFGWDAHMLYAVGAASIAQPLASLLAKLL